MRDAIDELETALAEAWDRQQLAVYADALQAAGDPRGALISLDLYADAHGVTVELLEQRRELSAQWLGSLGTQVTTRYGFIELVLAGQSWERSHERLDALLASGAARWLRRVMIREVWPGGAAAALDQLGHREWPFLSTIALELGPSPEPIASPIVRAAIRSTPRLERLAASGACPAGFGAAALRTLTIDGTRALATALAEPFPSVTELDLAMRSPWQTTTWGVEEPERDWPADTLLSNVDAEKLPALRSLDLSRNEPGAIPDTRNLGGEVSIFERLRRIPDRARLVELRLPSLRSADHVDLVQHAIAGMPALARLAVARMYDPAPPCVLSGGAAAIEVPAPVSWPPRDRALVRRFRIALDDDEEIDVDEATGIALMETTYPALPPDMREAWDRLWKLLDEARTEPRGIAVGHLNRVLDAIEIRDPGWRWRKLRAALRPLATQPARVLALRASPS